MTSVLHAAAMLVAALAVLGTVAWVLDLVQRRKR